MKTRSYLHDAEAFLVFICVWTNAQDLTSERSTARRRIGGGADVMFDSASWAFVTVGLRASAVGTWPDGFPTLVTSLPVVGGSGGGAAWVRLGTSAPWTGKWFSDDDGDDDVIEGDGDRLATIDWCCRGELDLVGLSWVVSAAVASSSRDLEAKHRHTNAVWLCPTRHRLDIVKWVLYSV